MPALLGKLRSSFPPRSARIADVAALAAGAVLSLAFAPFGLFPLAVLAPAALFLLWHEASAARAAWRGYLFGLGMFGVGVSWVYVAIHDFGYASLPLAAFLTLLFVGFLALYPALLGYLSRRFLRSREALSFVLGYPAAWVLMEWFRGWFLTGFPWLDLGYSQIDSSLAGYAPLLGVYGVSLTAALSAGLVAYAWRTAGRARFAAIAGLTLLWGTGALLARLDWTQPSAPPFKVAIVQGNIPQDTKWRPELVQYTLDLYAGLTRQHWDARLILWPEAAVTAFHHEVAGDWLPQLAREAHAHDADVVLGIPVYDRVSGRLYNSILSLSARPGFYHKRHLVPFGDFVPFERWLRGLIRFFDLPMSGFSPGPAQQPLLEAAGQKLAATVCYEDAFGEELIDALPAAALIVNGTNNAWYGDSFAPHQALEMSRMRALETGRYLLRATTNGVSAIVGANGRVVARSPQFETFVLRGEVEPRQGATPYVRTGNWPVLALLSGFLVSFGIRALAGRRRAR